MISVPPRLSSEYAPEVILSKAESGPHPIYTTLEINLVFAQNVPILKLKPAVGYRKIPGSG